VCICVCGLEYPLQFILLNRSNRRARGIKQMAKHEIQRTVSDILIYQIEGGDTKIEVRLENETMWLTQKQLSELFQVAVPTINEYIKKHI